MPRKAKPIVLDTWAIMAYLRDEPAGEQVETLIAESHEHDTALMMSVVNVAEVWYAFARLASDKVADQAVLELKQLGIEFIDAHLNLALEAARFKAKHKMSLADCFATALAKERKADLVTGDREFKQVESEVKILWV